MEVIKIIIYSAAAVVMASFAALVFFAIATFIYDEIKARKEEGDHTV